MRILPTTALAVAVGLALAACSSGGSSSSDASSGDVTITFMEAMSSGALKTALADATARFEEANPQITVELVEQPDYSTLLTKIQSQVAAGDSPTIAQVSPDWAVELADSGVITPLDDRIAADSSVYDGFYDGIKEDMQLVDGQNWMWPFNKSLYVQYYNPDLVDEAPTTWTDFADTLEEVTKDGVVGLSTDPGGSTGVGAGSDLVAVIAKANGGDIFDAEGNPTFTDPKVVEALQTFVDLKADGALATGKNYPGQQALGAQKGAFDLSTVAAYQYNLAAIDGKFDMGVAPLPEGTDGAANLLSGTNIAMFDAASDEEQDAAWAYMQFLTGPEEMAQWAASTGYLPISDAAAQESVYTDYEQENPWVADVIDQLDIASRPTPRAWTQDALTLFATAVSSALAGSASAADALADAQEDAEALVG